MSIAVKQTVPVKQKKEHVKIKPTKILTHVLLILLVIVNLFPLYWMSSFSLKTTEEIMGQEKILNEETGKYERLPANHVGLPRHWQWENYPAAMKTANMGKLFLNSLIVAAFTIVLTIIASFMATYAMTRLIWKGRKAMNKFFMLGLTIPIHAALIPVYLILKRIGLLGSSIEIIPGVLYLEHLSLIIPYAAFSLAMGILISVGFMGDIPYDLDEAAFLDGCGVWGIFFRVICPLMVPAISTLGIYTFLQCWNELLFATVYISDSAKFTLPVGIQQFFGQYTTDWGKIGAGLVIATAPTLVIYVILSKRIQAGFMAGAVKG